MTAKRPAPETCDYAAVAHALRTHAEDYRREVHEQLFAQILPARDLFPMSAASAHQELVPALAWYFEQCAANTPVAHTEQHLADLAREHRRHGFPPQVYTTFAECLVAGLDTLKLKPADATAAAARLHHLARVMADAAEAADLAGTAPAHRLHVVGVRRPNRQVGIVKLSAGLPTQFAPGQFFAVTTRHLPGTWRELYAAAPPTAAGELEFHIHATGPASQLLRAARVGDEWTVGSPRGEFAQGLHQHSSADGVYPVLLCFGTGWAPARAWLLGLVDAAVAAGQAPDIEASVYVIAPSPGHHYDVVVQENLAALNPDMRMYLLVDSAMDPQLLGAEPPVVEMDFEVSADPVSLMLERETTRGNRFILCGPSQRVAQAQAQLLAAGVDCADIEAHPFDRGGLWELN
ncbi:2-polyprenylphenol hydroxylase [Corynebacterium lizhenjunii]|uniref:2-polyprenylphenol hydroxylase n=1 Tax=Corynebacterium lizhenjunii TaxID=2709394 RepID=UPI0013ED6E97|nr:2-polyprenylphenol hydroxylase [Corynebacterium lizhenjunii]